MKIPFEPPYDIVPLKNYKQQVKVINEKAVYNCGDLSGMYERCFHKFYDFVCAIPYREDGEYELNARPGRILELSGGIDCKKKSTLIAAYCNLHGISYRLCVISAMPNKIVHHIFPEIYMLGKWVPADATYPGTKLGERMKETYREVFYE